MGRAVPRDASRNGRLQRHAKGEITGRGGKRLGIDNLARRGIAGRGVLADVARYYESIGKSIDYTKAESIPLEDLEATLAASEESSFAMATSCSSASDGPSSITAPSPNLKEELARETVVPGIEGTHRVAEWIWNHHLAAVASDSPALEALPKAAGDPEFCTSTCWRFSGCRSAKCGTSRSWAMIARRTGNTSSS